MLKPKCNPNPFLCPKTSPIESDPHMSGGRASPSAGKAPMFHFIEIKRVVVVVVLFFFFIAIVSCKHKTWKHVP